MKKDDSQGILNTQFNGQLNDEADLSIYLCEDKLKLGWLDNVLFGKDAGHSYLALVDNRSGEVLSEINGTTYDRKSSKLGGMGGSPRVFGATALALAGLSTLFNNCASKLGFDNKSTIRLRGFVTDGQHKFDKSHPAILMGQGSEADMLGRWYVGCKAVEAINEADFPYVPFATLGKTQNCHAVTSDVITAMGYAVDPKHLTYAAPGFKRRLLPAWNLEGWKSAPKLGEGIPAKVQKIVHEIDATLEREGNLLSFPLTLTSSGFNFEGFQMSPFPAGEGQGYNEFKSFVRDVNAGLMDGFSAPEDSSFDDVSLR